MYDLIWAECDVVVIAMVTYVVQYLCINSDTDYTSVAVPVPYVVCWSYCTYVSVAEPYVVSLSYCTYGSVAAPYVVLHLSISSGTICGIVPMHR